MNERGFASGMQPVSLDAPWEDAALRAALPVPAADSNKYTRGVLTVVAGCARYPGAACLTAYAGQRMGAGFTEVVTCKAARRAMLATHPSLVVCEFDSWEPADLRSNKRGARHALCVGPGFDPDDGKYVSLVTELLETAEVPVLVDGGGLAALGSQEAVRLLRRRGEEGLATVLTPHGGEALRLARALGLNTSEPARLALLLAASLEAVVVVKGPDSFISDGERVIPMREGTAALAKAGSGDVLAGMMAALLAQGVDPVSAAVLGATLHARAGVAAARLLTEVCVTSEDVIAAIPDAVRTLL